MNDQNEELSFTKKLALFNEIQNGLNKPTPKTRKLLPRPKPKIIPRKNIQSQSQVDTAQTTSQSTSEVKTRTNDNPPCLYDQLNYEEPVIEPICQPENAGNNFEIPSLDSKPYENSEEKLDIVRSLIEELRSLKTFPEENQSNTPEPALSESENSDVVSYQNDTYSVETITPISCHPAIKEIIDTEEVYLNDLNITINEIKKSLMKEMPPEETSWEKMFGNIEEIRDFSTYFFENLKAFEQKPETNTSVEKLFLVNFEHIKEIYMAYCCNHQDLNVLESKFQKNEQFQDCLQRCVKKISDQHHQKVIDLATFLHKPVQRITRYPLLLKQLLKQTDCGNPNYKDILQASEVSEKVVEVINEEMKQLDILKQAKSKIEKKFSETPFEKSKRKSIFSFNIGQKKVESDEKDFDLLVQRFESIAERLQKFFQNCKTYLNECSLMMTRERNCLDDLNVLYKSESTEHITSRIESSIHYDEQLFKRFYENVQHQIILPVSYLLGVLQNLVHLINTRNEKSKEYGMLSQLPANAAKEKTKKAKEVFEVLNQRLMNELPQLCDLSCQLLEASIKVFLQLQMNFYNKIIENFQSVFDPDEDENLEKIYENCSSMKKQRKLILSSHNELIEAINRWDYLDSSQERGTPQFIVDNSSLNECKDDQDTESIHSVDEVFDNPIKTSESGIHHTDVKHEENITNQDDARYVPIPPPKIPVGTNEFLVVSNYDAESSFELSLTENDLVTVKMYHSCDGDTNWWLVADQRGMFGFVPSSYLRKF